MVAVSHLLIACDQVSDNEIDVAAGTYRALADPMSDLAEALQPAFSSYVHEHPVISHFATTATTVPE